MSAGQVVVPQVVVSGNGVSVHVAVPLHSRSMQSVSVHSMGVPAHPPVPQTSPYVHSSPSSQVALVRHCQIPPTFVQR